MIQKAIGIKPGIGVVFSPIYVKTDSKLIQECHIREVNEPILLLLDYLTEAIVDETKCDLTNFNCGHHVVAHNGSGYLHLQFGKDYPHTGTYLFPTVEAMVNFRDIVTDLQDYLQQNIKLNEWEHVTLYRKRK